MTETMVANILFDAATATWPADWVRKEDFVAYVRDRDDGGVELSDVAVAALYLACACLRGVQPAVKAFESQYLPDIRRAGGRVGLGADQLSELAQRLREQLLVGRGGAAATLGDYRGRGDLHAWLRVTATREAIRMKKGGAKFADSDVEQLEARASGDDPELSYMKALYREAFRAAFRTTVGKLDPREKQVLHQHTVQGMTIDDLGTAHGVHRATAARWVQTAREKMLSGVRQEMAQKLQVSPKELASILTLVQSHLEVTMRRLQPTGGSDGGK